MALVPAAGFGTRFHEGGPKALVLLAGRPLLRHALERLEASNRVARAVVAFPPGHEAAFAAALDGCTLAWSLVEGGLTRRASVTRAFEASGAAADELVCVHDAARPLVDPAEVAAVVDAAGMSGAAIAGYSIIETVKRVEDGRVSATVPRHDLVAATTPQVFRAGLLAAAFAREAGREVTDDAELVERGGGATVSVVLTSRWNVKITYPEDLVWAEAYLRASDLAPGGSGAPGPARPA